MAEVTVVFGGIIAACCIVEYVVTATWIAAGRVRADFFQVTPMLQVIGIGMAMDERVAVPAPSPSRRLPILNRGAILVVLPYLSGAAIQHHKMQRDKPSSQLAREKRMMTRNASSGGNLLWRWIKDELLEWLAGSAIVLGGIALMLCIYAVGSLFR